MYVYANELIKNYYDPCTMSEHYHYCLKDPVSDEVFVRHAEYSARAAEMVDMLLPGIGADLSVQTEMAELTRFDAEAARYGNTTSALSEENLRYYRDRYEKVKSNVVLSADLIQNCSLESYRPEKTFRPIADIRETAIQWLRYNQRRRDKEELKKVNVDWFIKELYKNQVDLGKTVNQITEALCRKIFE